MRIIAERGQNHMNVIGHDHGDSQSITLLVIMNTAAENNITSPIGQNLSKLCIESNEMRSGVALHVGKIAAVELHTIILSRGVEDLTPQQHKRRLYPNLGELMEGRTPPSAPGVERTSWVIPRHCPRTRASGAPSRGQKRESLLEFSKSKLVYGGAGALVRPGSGTNFVGDSVALPPRTRASGAP